VDGVDLVLHFDPPAEHKAYLHRSGRTARAGAAGSVVTLVLPEQTTEVAGLSRRAGVVTKPGPQAKTTTGPRDAASRRGRRPRSTSGRR
jgi:superfamily II DNA/RNA helicase